VAAEPTDAELVALASGGDRAAFAALSERHGERLLRFLRTMTGDEHRAADVLQQTLAQALPALPQLRQPERFGAWLLSIACNACRRELRQQVQRTDQDDAALAAITDPRRSALSSIVRREDATALLLAIDRLPILLREAFVLFAVEGLPYAEIAAITAVAEGTLQVRVHRAKALLRQQLGARVDTWWTR
jgi:RNA polymerase sigma-70 factor (ECF subfamily)